MIRKPTIKRLFAYIIDILIISLIASALSKVRFINPRIDEYNEIYDGYEELVLGTNENGEQLSSLLEDDKLRDLTYDLTYYGIYMNIITLVVTASYFVGFQYFTKGQTLGKKLFKIQIVSRDGKDVSAVQLLKRSVIIHSLVTSTILLIMVSTLSKENYMNYSSYVQIADYGLIFLSIGFVIYREDGIGLHDLFGGTRVIMVADRDKLFKKEIKEANVVEEVEETEEVKIKKKTTKKTTKKDK